MAYMRGAPPPCRRPAAENRTPDAPPPLIPTNRLSFCLSQCVSTWSGTYFLDDNILSFQGGLYGALAASTGPSQHTHTHLFHTPPHLLPSMYPYADRHAPSSLGRVASARDLADILTLLNVEQRAAVGSRRNISSITRRYTDLRICRDGPYACGHDGCACVVICGTVADRVGARGLGTDIWVSSILITCNTPVKGTKAGVAE